jgi:phosphatidate cytidylyltransferase
MKRVLTAVVALPILLYATWSSQPYLFFAIAALAILAAVHEFFFIADKAGAHPFKPVGYAAAAAALVAAAFRRPDLHGAILAATTVVVMIWTLARVEDKSRILVSAGATLLAVLYVAVLGSYLVAIRAIPTPGMPGKLLTLFFAIIMMSDTGAYYTGRSLGRHKLAPRVSPGKTVEGSVGGLVASTLAAVASKYIFFPELPLPDAVALGAGMGVLGQVGDLCESLLKRGSDVKDAASILPGHGGFLDRLDSMLLNAPVLYYYYVYILAPRLPFPG